MNVNQSGPSGVVILKLVEQNITFDNLIINYKTTLCHKRNIKFTGRLKTQLTFKINSRENHVDYTFYLTDFEKNMYFPKMDCSLKRWCHQLQRCLNVARNS